MRKILTLITAVFVTIALNAQERAQVKDIAYKVDHDEYIQQKCRIDVDYEVDGFNHVDMAIPAHELLLKYMRQRK